MAWIYRNRAGNLMFSKVKPNKIYTYRFINNQVHSCETQFFTFNKSPDAIIEIQINGIYFRGDKSFELYEPITNELVKLVSKEECVFEGTYDMGFPVTFKPETISALKSVIDLESLTIENGLIEI